METVIISSMTDTTSSWFLLYLFVSIHHIAYTEWFLITYNKYKDRVLLLIKPKSSCKHMVTTVMLVRMGSIRKSNETSNLF
jgi:hypothetical protein